jgi:hypothetical protein
MGRLFGRKPAGRKPKEPKDEARLDIHAALLRHISPVQPIDAEDARYAPVEVMATSGARATVFAFGGIAQGFTMPVREFFGVLSDSGSSVVFLKDFHQAWYQKGLLGVTGTRAGTADFLMARFGDMPRPWIFTGSSSGAHAAIHYGRVMSADRIVAFGPQTSVDPRIWQRHRRAAASECDFDFTDPDNDLAGVLAADRGTRNVHIHFAKAHAADSEHAGRVAHLPDVVLHGHDTDVHQIARYLRDNGTLIEAIFGDTAGADGGSCR